MTNPYNKLEVKSWINGWKHVSIRFSPKSILDMRETDLYLCIYLHSGDSINFRGTKEDFAAEIRKQLPQYVIAGIPGMESFSPGSD